MPDLSLHVVVDHAEWRYLCAVDGPGPRGERSVVVQAYCAQCGVMRRATDMAFAVWCPRRQRLIRWPRRAAWPREVRDALSERLSERLRGDANGGSDA